MTDTNPELNPLVNTPDHLATDSRASFLARTSKAVAGAITGAVTTGGSALTLAMADGHITSSEGWTIAGAVVGGLVVGFAGVWGAPANKS